MRTVASSSSSSASETRSSTIVCAEITKPWAASTSARAIAVGSPSRTSPAGLAGDDRVVGDREDQVLRAAAARQQVGEDQLGVELDDPHEQLVVAERPDRADDAADEPIDGGRLRACPATAVATTPAHSRVIRSPSSCGMSGQVR